ncbi:acyltransferase family protein [Agromyces sp. SYSU T00194]|uniref:acyltransferase family protein n=1 Tax=Agromyces chitinivorans TaxID=3158560 RepID=UPI003399E093
MPGIATAPAPARPEFPFVDGFRGAAALLVVVYHAFLFTGMRGDAAERMPVWQSVIGMGYVGVPIFIVLSGFVLMLPVVTSERLWFRRGTWDFLKRRARRILPPYYAALVLTLILIAAVPVMQSHGGTQWDSKVPVTWKSILAHLFLAHDFSPNWIGKISGPLWSVAVEWHIYFLMPLLLLLWRRVPGWLVVTGLLVVSMSPAVTARIGYAHPWFIALFAAGMLAAQITMSDRRVRGVRTAMALAAVLVVVVWNLRRAGEIMMVPPVAAFETAVAILLATILVWGGRAARKGRTPLALRPFASRPALFLGLISYSVYLVHSPLLGMANLLLLPLGLSTMRQYLLLTLVVVPLVLVVCWLFYLAVERHFLNHRQRHASDELARARHEGISDEDDAEPAVLRRDPGPAAPRTGTPTSARR